MGLLEDLFSSNAIVTLLDSQSPNYIKGEPDSLVYNNLLPFMRIIETQTIADCYIMLSVDITNISKYNPTYALYRTTIWIMSHNDRMRVKGKSGTRIDLLSEEVKKLLDGTRKYGFSEFELNANREIILNNNYIYRELVFTCNDQRHPVSPEGKKRW